MIKNTKQGLQDRPSAPDAFRPGGALDPFKECGINNATLAMLTFMKGLDPEGHLKLAMATVALGEMGLRAYITMLVERELGERKGGWLTHAALAGLASMQWEPLARFVLLMHEGMLSVIEKKNHELAGRIRAAMKGVCNENRN